MFDWRLFALIVGVVFAAGLLLSLIVARASAAANDDSWRKFAERHRLNFAPQGGKHRTPLISGLVDGRSFSVHLDKVGNNNAGATAAELELRGKLPSELACQPQKVQGNLLKKMVHGRDIETGDSSFDERVVLKVGDPRMLPLYLSEARKRGMLKLVADEGTLEKRTLKIRRPGRVSDVEELERVFRTLRDVAQVIDTA